MARYKWDSPQEWLIQYASKLDASKLFQEFSILVQELDADKIQDLYQSDMDADGYFTDLDARAEDDEECTCPEADHPHRHCGEEGHGIYGEGEECPSCVS